MIVYNPTQVLYLSFSNLSTSIHTYSNETNLLTSHTDTYLGFGNSLPGIPLKKVVAGRSKLEEICHRLNKVHMKQALVNELINLLKSQERCILLLKILFFLILNPKFHIKSHVGWKRSIFYLSRVLYKNELFPWRVCEKLLVII